MKKRLLTILLAVVAVCCISLAACGKTDDDAPRGEMSFKLVTKGATLEVGETFTVEYEKTGEGNISWKSLDETVATVSGGEIVAEGVGETKIEANFYEITDVLVIKVEKQTSIPQLNASSKTANLETGDSTKIALSVTYKDKLLEGVEFGASIAEGDEDAATVSIEENYLVISANKAGKLSVTVFAEALNNALAEKVTVIVKDAKPVIVVENAAPSVNGYTAEIAAIENEAGVPLSFKPKASVLLKGKTVENAEIEWSFSESEFVYERNGEYFGNSAGSSKLVGKYENAVVEISVDCIRPLFSRTEEAFTLELADGIILKDLAGRVEAVNVNGKDIFERINAENGLISLKIDGLKTTELGVDTAVRVVTDKAEYEYYGKIYTDVITDEEELNDFPKNALAVSGKADVAEGYFVLGNDIVCSGEYNAYEKYPFAVSAANGFVGVFDGAGYIIKNLTVTGDRCGFIPMLGGNGVIRNVIFLNASLNGNGGFISSHSYGTVENLYIEISVTDNYEVVKSRNLIGDNRFYASVIASEAEPALTVRNVVVKYLNSVSEDSAAGQVFTRTACKINGLIVVGHETLYSKTEREPVANSVFTYASEQTFKENSEKWSAATSSFSPVIFNVTSDGIEPARKI